MKYPATNGKGELTIAEPRSKKSWSSLGFLEGPSWNEWASLWDHTLLRGQAIVHAAVAFKFQYPLDIIWVGGLSRSRLAIRSFIIGRFRELSLGRSVLKPTGWRAGTFARPQYLLEIRKLAGHLQLRPPVYPICPASWRVVVTAVRKLLCNLAESSLGTVSRPSTLWNKSMWASSSLKVRAGRLLAGQTRVTGSLVDISLATEAPGTYGPS